MKNIPELKIFESYHAIIQGHTVFVIISSLTIQTYCLVYKSAKATSQIVYLANKKVASHKILCHIRHSHTDYKLS